MAPSRGNSARGRSTGKRKSARRPAARSGGAVWPWIAALVAVGGGIALYDHSTEARRFVAGLAGARPVQMAEKVMGEAEKSVSTGGDKGAPKTGPVALRRPVPPTPVPEPSSSVDSARTAAIIPPAPIGKPVMEVAAARPSEARVGSGIAGGYEGKFFLCGSAKQDDCVVTADQFVLHGQKIRLVGVEVPDIHKPHCEAERIKASDAELRVRAFLDSGPFDVVSWSGNDAEVDGHKLRAITRDGRSLADILVSEGLAKRPGASKGWCG